MSSFVHYAKQDDVAVITIDNPPVNALSAGKGVVQAIIDGIRRGVSSEEIGAVVLTGAGRCFSGGADIAEFGTRPVPGTATIRDLTAYLDAIDKPMVCAIHGVTMGGGVETALGCHYRVATADARLGLPEVKLGLVPGSGGTQRLPRLVGLEHSVRIICTGDPVKAAVARDIGLVDEIIEGDLQAGAIAFATRLVAERRGIRRVSEIPVPAMDTGPLFSLVRGQVAKEARGFSAPLKCVDCIEAAVTRPFAEGLAFEFQTFDELMMSTESAALRHVFFAERAAQKIPDVPEDTLLIPIQSAAVVGAGTMGGGIAMNFANAGIPVQLLEMKQEALDRGLATIKKNYANTVAKGRLTQDVMDKRLALIAPTLFYTDLANADIVVEAVFEDMAVKKQVFAQLDRVARPGAIIATNTSTLDVNEIAVSISRPEAVIGLHFFSPANVMRLLEIVRGASTAKPVIATSMKLAKTIGKLAVLVGICDGFVGNRMVGEYLREAGFLLEEGATPQQVDRALTDFGLAMGPFAMSDLAGLDVGWYIRKRQAATRPGHLRYSVVADRICEMGRFGQKTGAGYYTYEPASRVPVPDPAIDTLIVNAANEAGVRRRDISDREIVERCIYALVNEGAKIVEEGIALRASDIDLVYINGYGFPAYRGGPMFYADTVGLHDVYAKIQEFHGAHGEFWKPAALLARLAHKGKRFND
jgi:3-hydroxyacyl-CoA dehydrogenase